MANDHNEASHHCPHNDPDQEDISAPNKVFSEPRPEVISDEVDECDFSDGVENVLQEDTGVLDGNFQSVHENHLYTNTWYYPMIIKRDSKDGLWRRRYIYHKSMSHGFNIFKRDNNDNRHSQYYRMMFVNHGDFDADIKTRQHIVPGRQYQLVSERNAYTNTKMSMSGDWRADVIEYIVNDIFNRQVQYKFTMNPKHENYTGDYYTKKVGNSNAEWIPEVGDHKFSWGGNFCNGMRLKSARSSVSGYLVTQENGDDIYAAGGRTENYIVFANDKNVGRGFVIAAR
ncbi:hypothetical protein BG011_009558 [Mortierella polycephala]|uniref:Uncharacterized protein n=1 Tax=Mortierella polycephala TaxID=41804 RepID=A0A9P6PMP0_9FUNG|nr:hypothetical protein BG011_009558 [Mortierella polycephala]